MTFGLGMVMPPASPAAQDRSGAISGTAKNQAKKPYTDYSVRARDVKLGTVAMTVRLDQQGAFALPAVDQANYVVELLNSEGKVVCTEGPFDLTKQPVRSNVNIECGKPAAWWLLAAAGVAGITAGVVANDPASPAR
jgi:hypothetical protein